MDWESALKILVAVVGVIGLSYTVRKFRMDKKNQKKTEQSTTKASLSGTYKNRTVFIHNSGSKATLSKVTVNNLDAFNDSDLEISDYTIENNQNITITIKRATNVLQPPYRVEIEYTDEYITKNAKKTGKKKETFRQSFN